MANLYTQRLLVLASLAGIFFLAIFTTFVQHYPLRNNTGDIWQYAADIHELQQDPAEINDPYFASGAPDIHYGQYMVILGIISRIFNINAVSMYLGMSIAMIFLVIATLYIFYGALFPEAGSFEKYCFVLIAVFCWGASKM